jgi:hypothetical protein
MVAGLLAGSESFAKFCNRMPQWRAVELSWRMFVTIPDGNGLNWAVNRRNHGRKFCGVGRGRDGAWDPDGGYVYVFPVAGALGYIATFVLIGRVEPDATIAATFGIIPLAVGIGFFVDHALIRRDAKAS